MNAAAADNAPDPAKAAAAELESLACFAWQAMLVDPAVAAALFRELVTRVPKSSEFWSAYGTALAKSQKIGEAVAALEKSLELRANNIEVWCVVAELSMDQLDWARATKALKRCLELDPNGKHPAGVRARALVKKGEKLLGAAVGTK